MSMIYDVFYDDAAEPAMRVREVLDEATGKIVYEDFHTGERVFLFAADTEIRLELVPDVSAEESGLCFLSECEAYLSMSAKN